MRDPPMTFLNAGLAFGALAFVVPLAIHLLNRSRFRTVDWGAMHLLSEVVRTNRRRFRLDQLLLLLVRCAIPVLLAFCLARPVWTGGWGEGAGGTRGDGPVSLAVVLDDSRSMGLPSGDDNGETRFAAAAGAVRELVAGVGAGSDVAVILAGGPPVGLTDAPTFDPAAVRTALTELEAGPGPVADAADLPAAVDAALAALSEMAHADRELVVLSDFSPRDFPPDAADALRRRTAAADLPPALTLLPVAASGVGNDDGDRPENVAVESVETPGRPVGVGRPVRLRATLRNHGPADRTARVTLSVDGAAVDGSTQSVTVPAGGTAGALFAHAFDAPGPRAITVTAAATGGPDALPADDVAAAVVRALGRLPVLLVDGAPSREPLGGETDFLSVALTPLTFGGTGGGGAGGFDGGAPADLIETRTVAAGELSAEALDGTRLVVLANVARLSDAALAALEGYVDAGGALLIAAGDKVDLRWHRDRLHAAGLLPRPWVGVAGADGPPSRVLAERFDHPALAPFNDPAAGDLGAADVRRWMTVEEPANPESAGRVIARLDTADPLLIVAPYGRGTVVQMTTAVDADWSDLPLRPTFVPLMQGLAATLAARPAPPANLRPGEPAVLTVPAVADAVLARTPDGRRVPVPILPEGDDDDARRSARFEGTRLPGVYTLTPTAAAGDDATGGNPSVARFAVAADPRESAPETLTAEDLAALADRLGATVVPSAEAYRARDDRRRHGRELWTWLLAGLLAALLLEVVLQQRFGTPPGGGKVT